MDAKTKSYLKALGYEVVKLPVTQRDRYGGSHREQTVGHVFGVVRNLNEEERDVIFQPLGNEDKETEQNAWKKALAHSRSPEGMVLTHSAKEAWLLKTTGTAIVLNCFGEGRFTAHLRATLLPPLCYGDSPQAAVEALCRKVLEAKS